MRLQICLAATAVSVSLASAQTARSTNDSDLVTLTTPSVLQKNKTEVGLDLRPVFGIDKLVRTGLSIREGFSQGLELDVRGNFARVANLSNLMNSIRYGGSDGEVFVKYRPEVDLDVAVEAGLAYAETPAQPSRISSLLGLDAGYRVDPKLRIYAEPKVVFLSSNTLFGVGLGAAVDVLPKVSVIGDWTPLFAGNNTLGTGTGRPQRLQIYGIGLRFLDLAPGTSFDVGLTNSTGQTMGSSLTPALGNSTGLYLRATYRF